MFKKTLPDFFFLLPKYYKFSVEKCKKKPRKYKKTHEHKNIFSVFFYMYKCIHMSTLKHLIMLSLFTKFYNLFLLKDIYKHFFLPLNVLLTAI